MSVLRIIVPPRQPSNRCRVQISDRLIQCVARRCQAAMDRTAMTNSDFDPARGIGATLAAIAIEAGIAILDVFHSNFDVDEKSDHSPVTAADKRAERIILQRLVEHFPDVPVIAEESVSAGQVPAHEARMFLVDPLDGTREFIAGRGEFTVNIALIDNGAPIAGALYAPAWRDASGWICFADGSRGACEADVENPSSEDACLPPQSAWRRLSTRKPDANGMKAVASRSHLSAETRDYLARIGIEQTVSAGSALKFCLLARGEADVYPRLSPTMEWDTAAGDAILRAAGGCVVRRDGEPMDYGQRPGEYLNPHFIAWGTPEPPERFRVTANRQAVSG
ncbi:3'(2'),5'-bisphosphate nucleotidase CysQ [Tepidamorphus sp. 3E244]|uniref:3'(2'),5'-bisphosphate nucleotidase CysQ n=1 Tax=Tepidamorphus sp. 3E244 TaxID=3385498 RepID=UPI0038FC2CE9